VLRLPRRAARGRGCTPSETAQLRNFARNCSACRFPGRVFVIALRVVGSCGVATSLGWFSRGGGGFGYCPLGWGGLNFWIWVLCQAKSVCGPADLPQPLQGWDPLPSLPRVAPQPWATLRIPVGVGEKLSEGRGTRGAGAPALPPPTPSFRFPPDESGSSTFRSFLAPRGTGDQTGRSALGR
jgi:hypothetical protein